jgi:hypothetical protein
VRSFSLAIVALVLLACLGGCGAGRRAHPAAVLGAKTERCTDGELLPLGSTRIAYVAVAPHGATAYRRPDGAVVARFGATNLNDYPTVFGVVGAIVGTDCRPRWYRAQLPLKPNGATGFVRARGLELQTVRTRIEVDISARRLTLYRGGTVALTATVAVGSPSTPTPSGRFYVNQRLVPTDSSGPFGPAAIGVSAFSNVLTGWTQGGPIAIHGTNEPWSIGHAVSNGCIRLPNATLAKLFRVAVAGTPVIIRP